MTDIVAQLDPRFQRVSTQQQGATEIQRPKRVARQYQNHPPATALGYYYQGSLSGVW